MTTVDYFDPSTLPDLVEEAKHVNDFVDAGFSVARALEWVEADCTIDQALGWDNHGCGPGDALGCWTRDPDEAFAEPDGDPNAF
jgi:hypothetical protein